MPNLNINRPRLTQEIDTDMDTRSALQLDQTDPLKSSLQQIFGFDTFRMGQREVIELVLKGTDALVMMATGSGKTVCFCLPAVIAEGYTIIVMPTLSLIYDMKDRLQNLLNCVVLNSETSTEERDRIYNALAQQKCNIDIVLTTPESLTQSEAILPVLRKGKENKQLTRSIPIKWVM